VSRSIREGVGRIAIAETASDLLAAAGESSRGTGVNGLSKDGSKSSSAAKTQKRAAKSSNPDAKGRSNHANHPNTGEGDAVDEAGAVEDAVDKTFMANANVITAVATVKNRIAIEGGRRSVSANRSANKCTK
jgi:hypothetical protein